MFVTPTQIAEGGRRHHAIGRIKSSSSWRAANAPAPEADRLAALQALIRKAAEFDADAIVSLDFEVDGVDSVDLGGAPLRRVAATGIAVRYDEAA